MRRKPRRLTIEELKPLMQKMAASLLRQYKKYGIQADGAAQLEFLGAMVAYVLANTSDITLSAAFEYLRNVATDALHATPNLSPERLSQILELKPLKPQEPQEPPKPKTPPVKLPN